MDDLTPITREETFLAAAGGQSVTLPEPLTREELFLAKAAGESVEPPEPITRKEMFLDAIQGGGGGGVTVEALTVTENGRYAEEGKAYNPVLVDVPQVSGNPNYVETISGTLANPWGEYAASELFSAARGGELTMYISASVTYSESGTAETATMMFFPISGAPTFGFTKPGSGLNTIYFARIGYGNTGKMSKAVAGNINTLNETQELLQIPSDTATTLTIIHHPMTGSMQMAESATFGGNA